MKKRFIILLLIVAVVAVVAIAWYREATSPVNTESTTSSIFVIQEGESIRSIASRLKNEGFIRDPLAFFILVKRAGVEMSIQAGDFRLNPGMSASEVLEELQHGTIDVWITVPEGWRVEEIALLLAQKLAVPEQEFIKVAEEGYMFPDTYLVPKQASAEIVAESMRDSFEKKITIPYSDDIAQSSLTLHEIVTIASLVEREALHDEDRPIIAGIIFNRLESGMALNIDATLQYALGYQSDERDWWKKNLTNEDKEIDSPYNTYLHAGIPPGPIANPGEASIRAVLYPEETVYYYYLSDPNGINHYAVTLEEHNQNIEQYLRN